MPKDNDMLKVTDLKLHFDLTRGFFARSKVLLKAVDGVSFSIRRGRTFGLVGESGCGKTTVGRTLVRLYKPTSGTILFDGTDISCLNDKDLLPYRPRMQMIFQDPYSALNPRMTVGDIISEPLRIQHKYESPQQIKEAVRALIDKIGLKPDHINRY
nr:ATP-binding cassette domain-containing protein [Clostridia bacterium]